MNEFYKQEYSQYFENFKGRDIQSKSMTNRLMTTTKDEMDVIMEGFIG